MRHRERRGIRRRCTKPGWLLADDVEEELVDAGVVGELGVEGGGEDVAGADEGGVAVAGGEGLDAGAGAGDAGGADEDHLDGAAGEGGFGDGGWRSRSGDRRRCARR